MEASRDFVYQKFCEYYRDPLTIIPAPVSNNQREFAYLLFKERFMVRHKRFEKIENLRSVLNDTVPSDVYHSCAYYENPDFDMNKKGWLGADLVFDIDADHIPSTCDKKHDEWTCNTCGKKGRGNHPEVCRKCKGTKFEVKTWPCDKCIAAARAETVKLIDILQKDFGLSDSELHVFFSGHRGYHVHVENGTIQSLDAMARKEIVDYVTCLGLNLFEKRPSAKTKKVDDKFRLHNFGWNKRLKTKMSLIVQNASKEDLQKIVGRDAGDLLILNKEIALTRSLGESLWDAIPGISDGTWMRLALNAKNQLTSMIDTVVTTDIHRLIRMNGTLHGKTGLKKAELPFKNWQDLDPFKEAIAFKKGKAEVLISDAPMFKLGGETLGPYKDERIELPVAAAVMLICKGRAKVAN